MAEPQQAREEPRMKAHSRIVAELNPAAFAFVMATGIVSIAAFLLEMPTVALILLWANALFFTVLWVLILLRCAFFFPRVAADLRDHARGPGFFTTVAGTCVFGSQLLIVGGVGGRQPVPFGLWFLGAFLWFILTYAFFAGVMIRETKPTLDAGMHGGWLIAVVATQSVSVLASLLAARSPATGEALLFTALCFFLFGGLLYIVIITLLFYRLLFFSLSPAALSPVYWVSMGAAAITALAGGRLILDSGLWAFLGEIVPFLKGFTLLFWATATWWIPLLVILGGWRHLGKRFPFRYETPYWSLVFPLGMYTASTFVLAKATALSFLTEISRCFIWVAFTAWAVTFMGMAVSIVKKVKELRES
jgi:tellurite resistance protein TehA-like permease